MQIFVLGGLEVGELGWLDQQSEMLICINVAVMVCQQEIWPSGGSPWTRFVQANLCEHCLRKNGRDDGGG